MIDAFDSYLEAVIRDSEGNYFGKIIAESKPLPPWGNPIKHLTVQLKHESETVKISTEELSNPGVRREVYDCLLDSLDELCKRLNLRGLCKKINLPATSPRKSFVYTPKDQRSAETTRKVYTADLLIC